MQVHFHRSTLFPFFPLLSFSLWYLMSASSSLLFPFFFYSLFFFLPHSKIDESSPLPSIHQSVFELNEHQRAEEKRDSIYFIPNLLSSLFPFRSFLILQFSILFFSFFFAFHFYFLSSLFSRPFLPSLFSLFSSLTFLAFLWYNLKQEEKRDRRDRMT